MTLEVWTARIGEYEGEDALNISRGSADEATAKGLPFPGEPWAPSWDVLQPALAARRHAEQRRKAGDLERAELVENQAWEKYVPRFTAEMKQSYRAHRAAWDELLSRASVTLLCFCTRPGRCHRTLVAELLGKCGATVRGERPRPGTMDLFGQERGSR